MSHTTDDALYDSRKKGAEIAARQRENQQRDERITRLEAQVAALQANLDELRDSLETETEEPRPKRTGKRSTN